MEPSDVEIRVSRWLLWVATGFFALAAGWELFGPILAGHFASSASMGIIAENMLRFRIVGPVWEYTTAAPSPGQYYCHHPWGIFWTTAALMRVFGRHDFVCRLAPFLLSVATPPLLYSLGSRIYRPAAGAAAALSFVVLPITLSFASFNALEVPTIAWSLVALWGYVRMIETWRKRHLAACLLGALLAMNVDWPAFVLVGEMLLFALFRGIVFGPRRFFGPVDTRRYAAFWALLATLCAATLLLYVSLFHRSNKLGDLLASYGLRSAGGDATLASVLESRRYWIELMFTPVAIALGKVMAIVIVIRLLALRREHEAVPLALLGMATVQYVVFRQGADIHIFWPHYFAAYFALAMGALVATLAPLLEGMWKKRSVLSPGRAPVFALGLVMLPLLVVLRDGLPALRYARQTGGRFNEKGNLIDSEGDKTAFLRWLEPSLPRGRIVDMHEGMKTSWAQVWSLGGLVTSANRAVPKGPAKDGRDTYLADSRFLPDAAQVALVSGFRVVAVGPFWKIDRDEPAGPIEAYSFVETEPPLWEWYFVSGTEPHREIQADPFATWELRTHFGQVATAPTEAPASLEQMRIAHNIAISSGDAPRALELLAAMREALRPSEASLGEGVTLVGTTFYEGARDLLTLYVEASGPLPKGSQIDVESRVTQGASFSTTMADPVTRKVGMPLAIAPERWRAGFLYADPVVIRKRPGAEVFEASVVLSGKPPPKGALVLKLP